MQVTYAEVAEQALGPVGKTVVEIQLVLSQTGFCAAYIIFIYSTLPAIVPLSETSIVLVILPFQVRTTCGLSPGVAVGVAIVPPHRVRHTPVQHLLQHVQLGKNGQPVTVNSCWGAICRRFQETATID